MLSRSLFLLLADDDADDCLLFREALAEIPIESQLVTVPDGVSLMAYLRSTGKLPDVLYLDLNMPRKGGLECLAEIKEHPSLGSIPVIVFSTTNHSETVDRLYDLGAQFYIQKPAEFHKLRNIISKSLTLLFKDPQRKPARDQFVLDVMEVTPRKQGIKTI